MIDATTSEPRTNHKATRELSKEEEWKYAEISLSWWGWGSPVGMGILLLCLGGFLFCLSRTGWIG